MKKFILYSFISLAVILNINTVATAQNIVANGGQEIWSGGSPVCWGIADNITEATTNIHSGNSSARHISASTTMKLSQDLAGIVAGTEYTISYWYLDNDAQAKTRIWAYWLSGAVTLPENADVLRPAIYSVDNSLWQHFSTTLVAPATADGFRFEVRAYHQDGLTGGSIYYDDFGFTGNVTILPEPSNYPVNFNATASGLSINLTWTDAIGTQIPTGYTILASINSAFSVPIDGLPIFNDYDLSNGNGALNVNYGIEDATFSGLQSNTTYYFTIYPFTNRSGLINYKTNAFAPLTYATTSLVITIETENFNSSWGNWTPISIIGDQVWDRNNLWGINSTPCAQMTGYSGAAFDNDDWLISPAMNFNIYDNEKLVFYNAKNYIGPDLECKISTNYDGGGDPYSADWTNLSYIASSGLFSWTSSGIIDISGYFGESVHIAFHYTSTTAACATWELDDIQITGEITIDPEPSNYPTSFGTIANGNMINVSWTDAIGTILPEKYIVYASISSSLPVPVDGTPVMDDPDLSDGFAALNVDYGLEESSFGNLQPSTTYYFTIYPYTNSDVNINYKTNETPPTSNATTSSLTTIVNLKTILEGPFFSGQMTPFLNVLGYLPTTQPYNVAPWNYSGSEFVTAIPNFNIIDWVLVELFQQEIAGEDTSFILVARRAAFLLNNGTIKDLDGTSMLIFSGLNLMDFYVRIIHRNHLQITSALPLTETEGVFNFDFTTSANQAMGGFNSLKELATNTWGMIAGDGNGNGQIDNLDKNDVWLLQDNLTGYYSGDYNMDSEVDDDDKIVKWEPNSGKGFDFSASFLTFECGSTFIDTRDGQTYNSVQIGTQCWMKQNLNIGTMIPGANNMANNSIIEKYCYENNTANCDVYGGLYQWDEMMQYVPTEGVQGICPAEWHLPTDAEWSTLTNFLGGEVVAGGKMKETGTLHWNSPNTGATNESGFTALPGGAHDYIIVDFFCMGCWAAFWPSTEYDTGHVWFRDLWPDDDHVGSLWEFRTNGFSVRCLKD